MRKKELAGVNTDREIWRKMPGDYYSPSIFVTEFDDIGINVGGRVFVATVYKWHEAGRMYFPDEPTWGCAHCGGSNPSYFRYCGNCGKKRKIGQPFKFSLEKEGK